MAPITRLQVPKISLDKDRPEHQVARLVEEGRGEELSAYLQALEPSDRILAVSRLGVEGKTRLLQLLDPEEGGRLLRDLPNTQAAQVVEALPESEAVPILDSMRSDTQVDLLSQLDPEKTNSLLGQMLSGEIKRVRELLSYPPNTAGGLMISEYLVYRASLTAGDVIRDLRSNADRYSDFEVQYAYITDADGRLVGVLRMRDLLFADERVPLQGLMLPSPISVPVDSTLAELNQFFTEYRFIGVPVVDAKGRLAGVLRRSSVQSAVEREANSIWMKISGIIGGEELRTMPLKQRAGRRLGWLSINILLNIVAASVIALHEKTLQAVIALAVFLPIISDMSGCSGNQAVAVSIRELTMGLIRPREYLRVFFKEGAVGIINGIALGVLLGLVAFVYSATQYNGAMNPYFGLVVGGALCINTVVAVLVGGLLPLLGKGLRLDPALVSGPLLTTVTDMCGFFLVLTFASSILPLLLPPGTG